MLDIKNLSFSYGKRPALRTIDLCFADSGLVALVGPNGSGKSTLLKCINRINHPRGEVLYKARKVSAMSASEVAGIFAYVPQEFSGAFPITVFDMILLGRRPYLGWNPSAHDIDIVSENIALMELDEFTLRYVYELSGGERQKVLIATALSQEPQVLLLDEPTSNLDIKYQLDVMKLLKAIVSKKKILALMAVHDLNLASQYADEIVMLNQGKVFARGKADDVLTKENIKAVYRVSVAIHRHGAVQHLVPVDDDSLTLFEKNNGNRGVRYD